MEGVDQSRLLDHFPTNGRRQNCGRLRDRQHLCFALIAAPWDDFYRVTVVVAHLGWVDLDLDVRLSLLGHCK